MKENDELISIWFIDEKGDLQTGVTSNRHFKSRPLSEFVHIFHEGVPHVVEKFRTHVVGDGGFGLPDRIMEEIRDREKIIEDLNKKMQFTKKRIKNLKKMLAVQKEIKNSLAREKNNEC